MSRPYKITAFDESVAALASRFAIAHPSVILDLNPDTFDEGGDATLAFEPSFVGLEIRLPDDPRTTLYGSEGSVV